jgi:hypothetical protein
MAQFNLTAEQIQNNYKKFFDRINKMFPERSEELTQMYKEIGEERLMFLPASGTEHYHNAIPGGYIDHVLRVMDFALLELKHYEGMGLDISNFTVKELMFAAMHHDLGKIGFVGDGKDGYVFNTSEWHRKNQGKIYSNNENIPFALVQDRSIFLLQSYKVQMSWNEFLSIRIHDGIYDDANKSYYISHQLSSKLRSTMPQILHNADLAAARFEFERWNKYSKSLNTERMEDVVFKPTKTVNGNHTSTTKKEQLGQNLSKSFEEIFKS